MSTCRQCALAADLFYENVKQWGWDAAASTVKDHIFFHKLCQYVDCYCQHRIEKVDYARD
jgi:hypothetical protein